MNAAPLRIAGACALTAALALSATACGNGEQKKTACDKLHTTISQVAQKAMTQVADPNAMAQTYTDGAQAMRQEGKDSGDDKVESAADDAASAFEDMGGAARAMAAGKPQAPDTSKLTNAGVRLKSACGS